MPLPYERYAHPDAADTTCSFVADARYVRSRAAP